MDVGDLGNWQIHLQLTIYTGSLLINAQKMKLRAFCDTNSKIYLFQETENFIFKVPQRRGRSQESYFKIKEIFFF